MLSATQSQLVAANSNAVSMITEAPMNMTGQLTWRLINDADGTIVIAESSDGIVAVDDGHDWPNCRYDRQFTTPSTAGRYLAIWRYYEEELPQLVVVAASPDAAFATADDVAKRLGRALSNQEAETVPFLLNMAATVIADAVGKDDGWAASLTPVPRMLRLMSVELVSRALPNPSQYTQIRQQVGSYSIAVSQATTGMALSDPESLMLRRAVFGRTTDSVHVESGFELAQDEYWLRKQSLRVIDPQESIAP